MNNIDINPLVEIVRARLSRIKPKDRKLIVILVVCIFGSFYFSVSVRPMLNNIISFAKQQKELNAKTKLLVSQYPDLDKIKQEIENTRKDVGNTKKRALDTEAKLVSLKQVPQLLDSLMKAAGGLSVEFESVKQTIDTDNDGLERLYIDIRFDSTYESAANYIKNIEEVSPFVKIQSMELMQSKKDPRNLINVFLRVSALLAFKPDALGELTAVEPGAKLSIVRSPLKSQFSADMAKKEVLKLTGITYRGQKAMAAAIINDTVVKIGDKVDGQKVEDISADSVVLDDGVEKTVLKVER